jgi:hypothetical protein
MKLRTIQTTFLPMLSSIPTAPQKSSRRCYFLKLFESKTRERHMKWALRNYESAGTGGAFVRTEARKQTALLSE